jgi:hypothetical protein
MKSQLLLILLLSACTHHTPAAKRGLSAKLRAGDYYPLKLGSSWTYEIQLLGETKAMEVRLLKETADGFIEDSTGARLKLDALGVRDPKRYLLQEPVEVGHRWTNVVSVSSVERYEIVAADGPCEAPAGSWASCVVVQSTNRIKDGELLVNEMTFARGVGIVRVSTSLESEGRRIPQTSVALIKYSSP